MEKKPTDRKMTCITAQLTLKERETIAAAAAKTRRSTSSYVVYAALSQAQHDLVGTD